MNSRPGRLTGSNIRPLPEELLARFKDDHPKRRLKSARYRVTGFRDSQGTWVSRVRVGTREGRPTWGYRATGSRRRAVKATDTMLKQSDLIAVEIEIDRGKGPRIYYTTLDNRRG